MSPLTAAETPKESPTAPSEPVSFAVSVALIIQALFFGDGGVLALGANCFNMALALPFVGFAVYKLLSRNITLTNPRRAVAAGMGSYVGLNVAAFCAAIEFGILRAFLTRPTVVFSRVKVVNAV